MKLNVKAFTLTAGLTWGGTLLLIPWWIMIFDGATGNTTFLTPIYRGYYISPLGSLIGLAWGLVDGAIGGFIFSYLYNFFVERFNEHKN